MRQKIRCDCQVAKTGPYVQCVDIADWYNIWGHCFCTEHKSPRDILLKELSDAEYAEVFAESEAKLKGKPKEVKLVKGRTKVVATIDDDGAYLVQQRDHLSQAV
jgi:hypothetical protein